MTERRVRYYIRRMRTEDVAAVRTIEEISYPNPWSENTFRGEIQNDSVSFPMVVVRKPGDRIIGYVIYWHIRDDVQITNIAVHPDFRGRGLGETLLKHVLNKVREEGASFVNLEVRLSNAAALSLYKKLGFELIGVRKGYYTNPDEDALVMGLGLRQ